ncbi:MAG TPA: hypothetical protein VFC44_18805 [Candidatus Saccharimonadales bacterium]|nr:hypothetical protein [Candidatus Saccharimonadales bacterium]
MKAWFWIRWILILPGAVAAMILVNIINGWTVAVIFPDFVDDCCKSWFGSLAFVCGAAYIAPKGKAITAIVIATAYCSFGLFGVVMSLRSGHADHATWWEILMTVLTVFASVVACMLVWSMDKHKQRAENSQLLGDENSN